MGHREPDLLRTPSGDDLHTDTSLSRSMFDMLESSSSHAASTSGGKHSAATVSRRPPRSPDATLSKDGAEVLSSPSLAVTDEPPQSKTEIEEDQGLANIINDFSGIIRLGDAPQRGGTIPEGSSTALPPRQQGGANGVMPPPSSKQPGKASIGGLVRKGTHTSSASMRAQTRDSVRDFINEQAHTVQVSDPNNAAPSPGTDAADVLSVGSPVSTLVSSSESASLSSGGSSMHGLKPVAAKLSSAFGDSSSDNPMDNRALRDDLDPSGIPSEGDLAPDEPITTFRFQHLPTEHGHHVVVGREGDMQRCEDEPITIPGAVQGFGVLILLEEDYDTGDLTVRQVSEVSADSEP